MVRRRFHVDPDVRGQGQLQLAAALEAVGSQHPPHTREQGAQADVARGRRVIAPERLGERAAADRMAPPIDQARKDDPGLAAGEAIFQAFAGPVDGQATTQANPET